ncbi:MAG: hypothetical protein CME65_09505 [Halobacteriovoraceae bacterium]|nr:hypothetical protein [Halobacteriovoraceae bacterium]|tara:strand:- start:7742 stop:9349 length:1608 start_codon:yes stop_codon:yes gene_type:complete
MKYYTNFEEIKEDFGLIIGNFDGVHLGHRELLKNFLDKCFELDLIPVVLTFDPHPAIFFNPKITNFKICFSKRKRDLLFQVGVNTVVELEFNEKLQQLSSREFLEQVVFSNPFLKYLALGHDFALGAGKEDSVAQSVELSQKYNTVLTQEKSFIFESHPLSSTRIRDYIRAGEIKKANDSLGRSFKLEGIVEKGEGIGSKSLFPTLNLNIDQVQIIPSHGVYLTKVQINGKTYNSLTNIGVRPTIADKMSMTVETHVLEFSSDVYGERVELEFLDKVREEKKFSSFEELKLQIKKDIEQSKELFKQLSRPHLALVGHPVAHSESPNIYERIFDKSISYDLLDFPLSQNIPSAQILLEKYDGISITSPYKQHFLNEVETQGEYKNALNTLYKSDDKLLGVNTDYIGCSQILDEVYKRQTFSTAIILGDGSMSHMLQQILKNFDSKVICLSRRQDNLDHLDQVIDECSTHSLVINSCSREYIFRFNVAKELVVWDLNYNSESKAWFRKFPNIEFMDGIDLLERQAKNAVSFWNLDKQ